MMWRCSACRGPRVVKPRWHGLAILLYGLESWFFLDHGAAIGSNILGSGADPGAIMWFFRFWPWALTHQVHLPLTDLVWQPLGQNLAWTTGVPLLAFLALPVTQGLGVIAAYNLMTLAAPFSAALAAYVLCLELFSVPLAAIMGGWLFGFSSYETVQCLDHLNLDFCCLVPLVLWVALRRLRGGLGRKATVIWLGLLLGGEFLISPEIFAVLLFFAGLAWLLGFAILPDWRLKLRGLLRDIIHAVPLVLLLAAPLLAGMATGPDDAAHPENWPVIFSTDFLNFFIPTQATLFGGQVFAGISKIFAGGIDEQTGYLGLPLILLLAGSARLFWREPASRIVLLMLGILLLLSLGPELQVAGHRTGLALPWAMFAHLPLLGAALPGRFMLFAFLAACLLMARFAAEGGRPRIIAGALVCISLLPEPHPAQPSPALKFFAPGEVTAKLGSHLRLLILPFGITGQSSFWQGQSNFAFTQVGGYLGYPPRAMQSYPAVMQLFSNTFLPSFNWDFAKLCALTHPDEVIVTPGTPREEWEALKKLDWKAQKIDDVTVFTVPRP